MKQIRVLVILMSIWLVGAVVTQAQSTSLIAFNQGDLWAWSPSGITERLTEWEFNGGPILSPDGRRIAYVSYASESVEQFGIQGLPIIAQNIWIMDIASRNFDRIADQSASPGNILRGAPSWSPDGTEIAWAEAQLTPIDISEVRLKIYNMNTGATRTLTDPMDLGFQDGGGIFLPAVKWGTGGIARLVYTFVDGSDVMNILLELFDPATGTKREFTIGDVSSQANQVNSIHWVNGQLAVVDGLGNWNIFDPSTGSRVQPASQPVLSNGSSTILTPVTITTSGNLQWQWQATTADGTTTALFTSFTTAAYDVAISPDGGQVAWIDGDTVNVWTAATRSTQPILSGQSDNYGGVPPFPSVVWSVMQWTTNPDSIIPISPPDNATGCLPTRLNIGSQATLAPGLPNNVRTEASANASRIGQIGVGQTVTIQEGSVCNSGIMWWRVSYQSGGNTISGWTAESNGRVYWLVPYTGGNNTLCPGFLPSRLAIGMSAFVLPGLGGPNAIISQVGPNRQTIGNIPENAQFTIIGGPQCDFDRNMLFWYVEYRGEFGWTAEGQNSTYWLEPTTSQSNSTTFCSGFLPSRLAIGMSAFVDDNEPNNIRVVPESSNILGQIPPGGTFSVIGGPVCGSRNDVMWWQVNYNGTIGWTAEGQGSTYWLAPR